MDKHTPSKPVEELAASQRPHTPGEKSGSVGYMLYVVVRSLNYLEILLLTCPSSTKVQNPTSLSIGPDKDPFGH